MAGQMGNCSVSITNLEIFKINSEQNFIVLKGSIPGKPGNLVSIQ
jgi:large subunit ribosomal protein L3